MEKTRANDVQKMSIENKKKGKQGEKGNVICDGHLGIPLFQRCNDASRRARNSWECACSALRRARLDLKSAGTFVNTGCEFGCCSDIILSTGLVFLDEEIWL